MALLHISVSSFNHALLFGPQAIMIRYWRESNHQLLQQLYHCNMEKIGTTEIKKFEPRKTIFAR